MPVNGTRFARYRCAECGALYVRPFAYQKHMAKKHQTHPVWNEVARPTEGGHTE